MRPDLELVAAALGATPGPLEPIVTCGYTRSHCWRAETGSGAVFLKQVEGGGSLQMLRTEALVYRHVLAPYLPEYVGFAERGERAVVAVAALQDALWPPPYPEDTSPLFSTLADLAATPAPPGLPVQQPRWSRWERVAEDPRSVLRLGVCSPDWLDDSLDALIAAEARADFTGDDFTHSDIYCDNVCFVGGRAILVDWGAARVSSRWVDVAQAVLSVREEGGTVPPFEFPLEDAFAAALAAHLAVEAAAPIPEWISPESRFREDMRGTFRHALRWAQETLELAPLR